MAQQIKDIQSGKDKSYKTASHKTIFHDIIESNLSDSDKQLNRLWQEGQVVVGAGTETTAWALTVAMFHILSNPSIRTRLEEELQSFFPDNPQTNGPPKWPELERLPYLTACIQEALRLSYGVTSRLARVAPDQVLKLDDSYEIPMGTPVSMSTVLVHRNPDIFPHPGEFRPDRWLENPRLDRYLVSFSKGTRQCAGINLAYAELYMALGGIFRRFGQHRTNGSRLVLHEMSHADVEVVADMFIPAVKKGRTGVKAIFERSGGK
ncbi:hypothetical protein VTN77DRAFT_2707 [Rasamsonia byssochlamydoides]|uniref:uncharacterized protein n=1 Tax=Rasamsonia byssochlamydoides TaxID=89139 RepID=UPI0037432517